MPMVRSAPRPVFCCLVICDLLFTSASASWEDWGGPDPRGDRGGLDPHGDWPEEG